MGRGAGEGRGIEGVDRRGTRVRDRGEGQGERVSERDWDEEQGSRDRSWG